MTQPSEEPVLVCAACGAEQVDDARFCDACGAPLGSAPGRRGRTKASRRERAELTREVRRARKAVNALSIGYRATGVVAGMFAILFSVWWYRLGTHGWEGTWIRRAVLIAAILWGLEAALLLVGERFVRRAPLVLAIVLASFSTVATVSICLQLDWEHASAVWKSIAGLRALYTIGLWFLVPAALRLKRLSQDGVDPFPVRHGRHGRSGRRDT